MYDRDKVGYLIKTIQIQNGINDKAKLSSYIAEKFNLSLDRSIYFCDEFAIRFSRSATRNFGNTVLSLSALQKYDNRPMIICVVMPTENLLLLANSTCLSKISHSSHEMRVDNIKGSFNGSDILRMIVGKSNTPENFEYIYSVHNTQSFSENLERLVESTNGIVGKGSRFEPNSKDVVNILESPLRAERFINSEFYIDLKSDLENRVAKVQSEIAIAAFIENVNIRGRIIEYLITGEDTDLIRTTLIDALDKKTPMPEFYTMNSLGDYSKEYCDYTTETDIKTKIMFLDANPKAYNIDKVLDFLSNERSVYMVFFVGINKDKSIKVVLCSMFQSQLLDATVTIHHWAGRNSRGVTQFYGSQTKEIINNYRNNVDLVKAASILQKFLNL